LIISSFLVNVRIPFSFPVKKLLLVGVSPSWATAKAQTTRHPLRENDATDSQKVSALPIGDGHSLSRWPLLTRLQPRPSSSSTRTNFG
jgi:hypothetical protein